MESTKRLLIFNFEVLRLLNIILNMGTFYRHIKEAIALNSERRPRYAKMSKGKTKTLSNTLILFERLCLPIALYFDLKGRSYNRKNINIISEDFVPMLVEPYDKLVLNCNDLTIDVLNKIELELETFLVRTKARIRSQEDIEAHLTTTNKFLKTLLQIEATNQIHLAMLKHLTESLVFTLQNGIGYADQSQAKTIKLTSQMTFLNRIAIKNALFLDKKANKFHREGIGIIVNDLPQILA